jgi:spermidine synthase
MLARPWLLVLLASWLLSLGQAALAAERIILEKKSAFNTIVVSEDDEGLRILRFAHFGARQSVVKPGDPDHIELPYARVMIPIGFLFVDEPQSALIIGLGGGTIPSFLRKRFPQMRIDVVDIDPGVVDVARSHFGFREDERMRAHVEDGRRFVEQTRQRYDLIFLDGFGADSVPPHLTTREFLTAVRDILTPQGAVIGNVWGRHVNRLYDSMIKTYRSVYPGLLIADVIGSGNKIVIATPDKRELPHYELVERAQDISRKLELRHAIAEVAERNLRTPGEDGVQGKLLTDAEVGALPAAR